MKIKLWTLRVHRFFSNTKNFFAFWELSSLITRNKAMEFNLYWTKGTLSYPLTLEFRYDRKTDHAGLHIWIHLYRFELQFDIYDHRHWDYKNNQYEKCECDSE